MIKYLMIVCSILTIFSCRKIYDAPIPNINWDLFNSPAALSLSDSTRARLEGVYAFGEGADFFGIDAALKCSYTAKGADTTYHVSLFCEKQVIYMSCMGKRLNGDILLNGYWRNMLATDIGLVRLTISAINGATFLLDTAATRLNNTIITGVFGVGTDEPTRNLRMVYQRKLYEDGQFEIVAHRGGGRTSDLLPASENSVEIIRLAPELGATGVEIDVRYTKDGIPILYHDENLNQRLIQLNGMVGPIKNYTYSQIKDLVKLTNGEKIPTLRQALDVIVYETPLNYVWLDTKFIGNMSQLRSIQVEYQQKAAAIGRNILITIGIPDTDVLKNFIALPNYQSIPSVCELTVDDVIYVNADIWAPRWTLGLQNEAVTSVHSQGRKAFVWTLDVPENIQSYFNNGRFDGILSNYPSSVAYYYYAKK